MIQVLRSVCKLRYLVVEGVRFPFPRVEKHIDYLDILIDGISANQKDFDTGFLALKLAY